MGDLGRILLGSAVLGWLVGWLVFSCSIHWGKNSFRLVWLINVFNRTETRLKRFQPFHRKRLEKCSIGKPQPFQPKPVAVETADPNRTRP